MRLVGCSVIVVILVLAGIPSPSEAGSLPRVEDQFRLLADDRAPGREISRALGILDRVATNVRENYVDAVGIGQMEDAAIDGMLKIDSRRGATNVNRLLEAAAEGLLSSLDQHSSYLSPEKFGDMKIGASGTFGGLGISVSVEDGRLKVVSPLDGTPAYRAGIKAGDIITNLDGVSTEGWTLVQAVRRMRGKPGTRIRLTIDRGGRVFDVPIVREIITIESVHWRREGTIAYIRISSFMENTADKLRAALRQMWAQPNDAPEGLVLDLRSNPGGLLSAAVGVADQFIESGDIVSIRGRKGDGQTQRAKPGDMSRGVPISVLIDGGTASGSEIVAASLRSLRRAVIVGVRSFGKGSVQTITPLDNGGALRLTTLRYYSDLGTTFDGSGLQPDIAVEKGPDGGADVQLAEAISALTRPSLQSRRQGQGRSASAAAPSRFPRRSPVGGFPQSPPRPDDVAVIIGNADYSRLGLDLPDVDPAYADAEGVKRYVVRSLGIREGNIIDLRDATGAQFSRVFGTDTNHKGQLFDWVRPGQSRVFIYYAGHGAPGGDTGGSYLVPADADGARIRLNGYPLQTLYRNLGRLPAERITVVLEACFSGVSQGGSVVPRSSGVFVRPSAPEIPSNVTVISAGTAEQVASWEEDGSHGLFTKYYLKAVAGEADGKRFGNGDGKVSTGELEAYLKDTLTYYARRYYGRDQTPQIVTGRAR
ncbi:MAG: PDZ domain-containing protein [Rhodospirillales bacterium]|jgi:C-terminal peptidase prc|nr:PDZ domain-containing protein [Rhodospirillales bacterium]